MAIVLSGMNDCFLADDQVAEGEARVSARELSLVVGCALECLPMTTLEIPVAGLPRAEVVSNWNAPRSGGCRHQGVDLFASRGTSVVSATGNAHTTPPHLHFGVYRVGLWRTRAVDPVPLLLNE